MNRAKKIGVRAASKILIGQFQNQCRNFEEKCVRFGTELGEDIAKLESSYGKELVTAWVGRVQQVLLKHIEAGQRNASRTTPTATNNTSRGTSPSPTPIRRKKRKYGPRNAVSFSELKKYVLQAVQGLQGKEFTIEDVSKILHEKKIKFKPSQPSAIISSYIMGVQRTGNTKKREKSGGPPLNLYKVNGPLAIIVPNPTTGPANKKE